MLPVSELNERVGRRIMKRQQGPWPQYSGNISHAWSVLDELIRLGLRDIDLSYNGEAWTAFVADPDSQRHGRATNVLASCAICVAGLKAIDPNSDGYAKENE